MRIGGTEPKAERFSFGPMREERIHTLVGLPGRLPVAGPPTLSVGTDVISIFFQDRRILPVAASGPVAMQIGSATKTKKILPRDNRPRLGVQEGEETYAWVKSTPAPATRSKLGVCTTLSPYALACGQPQSSAIANTMFGRWFSAAVPIAAHPLHSRKQTKPQTIFFNMRTFPKAGFYLSGCEDTRQGRKFPLDNLIDLCR